MKCKKCGAEASENAKFCKNCGASLDESQKRKCPNCGKEIDEDAAFCEFCGEKLDDRNDRNEKNALLDIDDSIKQSEPSILETRKKSVLKGLKKPAESSGRKKIYTLIAGLVIGAVAGSLISGISVRQYDNYTLTTGTTTLEKLVDEIDSSKSQLKQNKAELKQVNLQLESQKKKIKPLKNFYVPLAAGTYRAGTDIEPGIYHFTYRVQDDDAWGGDYIYVTHQGSKGTDKTLGGTSFDERVEGTKVKGGKQVSIKITAGDKVQVDTGMGGTWDAGKKNK